MNHNKILDHMEFEIEKIAARSRAGSSLELHATPGGLGIHSKREGIDHRALAYAMGVPTAAAAGIVSGMITGPATEGRFFNLFTRKGRKLIGSKVTKDVKQAKFKVPATTWATSVAAPKVFAGRVMSGAPLTAGEKQLAKNLSTVGVRRAGKMIPGAARAAAFAAGLKAIYNIGSYEKSKVLTPSLKPKRIKGV